jgi:hypothetical protein
MTRRYALRLWERESFVVLEAHAASGEAALARLRDDALGMAARLEAWAKSEEPRLWEVPEGADPPNLWENGYHGEPYGEAARRE